MTNDSTTAAVTTMACGALALSALIFTSGCNLFTQTFACTSDSNCPEGLVCSANICEPFSGGGGDGGRAMPMPDHDGGLSTDDAGVVAIDGGPGLGIADSGPAPVDGGPGEVDAGPGIVDAGPGIVDAGPGADIDAGGGPDCVGLVVDNVNVRSISSVADIAELTPANNACLEVNDLDVKNTTLANLDGLEFIVRVSGNIEIRNNGSLSDIAGLRNISEVAGGDISVRNNAQLPSCHVEEVFADTAIPNGTLSLFNLPNCP